MAKHQLTESDIDNLLSDGVSELSDIISAVATANNWCPVFARQVVYSRMDYLDAIDRENEALSDAIDGRSV
jgi:hypothetical protein